MGDSDEEEMKAMRNSSRYGGGRAPASAAEKEVAAMVASASAKKPPPKAPDSDDEETGYSARRRQQLAAAKGPVKPLGPSRPSASSTAAPAEDSDEPMEMEAEEPEQPGMSRTFLPVTFGRPADTRKITGGGATEQILEAAKRKDKHDISPKKAGGVSFGPRTMDVAIVTGASSRRAAASAKAMQEADEKARAEEAAEDEKLDARMRAAKEEEDMYGFGGEAPPAPGTESEVLPVTHEAVIPAFTKAVTCIGLDPKGSRMICGGRDGQCKFYDFNGMSEAKENFRDLEPCEGHFVQAISFSTTGGHALVVCSDAHARVFDRDGGSKPIQSTVKGDMYVRDMNHTQGHTQSLTDGMWHPFHPNNWVTSSLDGTLRIWDLTSKPVGMDQVLPCIHTLKTLDKRNACVGGACGRAGGLYPSCCAYSPNASIIVAGCTDGSVQFFFEKARYHKPDKILRLAHTEPLTCVRFLGDGVGGNKLVTRSLDNTMKLWDCRALSDAKGPLKTWEDLPNEHEKMGVCASPDGKYIVTGTSYEKKVNRNATLRVYSAEDFSLLKVLDFGQRSVVAMEWQKDINQVLVGTSNGEVVMLYSPFSSVKGALHFVGRHRRAKAAHEIEDTGYKTIFPMVDGPDIGHFYKVARGGLEGLRRQERREGQKTIVPLRPNALDGKTATTAGTKLVSQVILSTEGKSSVANQDSQKKLLEYADRGEKEKIYMQAYEGNKTILDYTMEESVGDEMMGKAQNGEFCRKCGVKICRCVDYTQFGSAVKKAKRFNER